MRKKTLVFESNRSISLKPPIKLPIKQDEIASMSAQIKMSEAFFMDMVECHKSREDYIRELNQKKSNDR